MQMLQSHLEEELIFAKMFHIRSIALCCAMLQIVCGDWNMGNIFNFQRLKIGNFVGLATTAAPTKAPTKLPTRLPT